MAAGRGLFQWTVARPRSITVSGATFNVLEPLDSIRVEVFVAGTYGTGSQATAYNSVFQDDTSGSTGPAPAAGMTGAGPYITGTSGYIEFWLPAGRYDIVITDTQGTPRIAQRILRRFPIVPGVGIPTSMIDPDGGLSLLHMGQDVARQWVPIGTPVDWWRPTSAVAVPAGYEICDGRQIASGSHDFGVAGAVNLPDLRNKFILGANVANADGTGATGAAGAGTELAASAPGIRGTGGSHYRDISHRHLVDSHVHSIAHTHAFSGVTGTSNQAGGGAAAGQTAGPYLFQGHTHNFSGNTGGVSTANSGGATPNTDYQGSSTQDVRPAWVGLLKIMKVRRS